MRLIIYISLLFLWGCNSQSELSPEKYALWAEDQANGLVVEKKIDNYSFTLQYKPAKYQAVKSWMNNPNTKFPALVQEYSGMQQFNLKIDAGGSQEFLRTDIGSTNEFFERVDYFNGRAQEDIKLIDGNDTLTCVLYHFERSFNAAPYCTLILGFPLSKKGKVGEINDKILVFNDQVLNVGKINIGISGADINKLQSKKIVFN